MTLLPQLSDFSFMGKKWGKNRFTGKKWGTPGTNPPPCLFETRKHALFPVLRGRNGELLYANQPISKPGITPIP